MRGIFLTALCLVAGCAAGPSLEQLERQALLTGDWSAVEKREHAAEHAASRRALRDGIRCASGQIGVCDNRQLVRPCRCVNSDSVYAALGLR